MDDAYTYSDLERLHETYRSWESCMNLSLNWQYIRIWTGVKMNSIPDWIQAALAGALFLGAAVGIYTTQRIQVASMGHRITVLEQEQRQASQHPRS